MATGVLLMGYGSPDSVSEVERYLRNIKAGHAAPGRATEPTSDEVARLVRRYDAIGGVSPFNRITMQQARCLQDSLALRGADVKVYIGMLNWAPSITGTVAAMAADGVSEILAMPATPIYSQASIGGYCTALEAGIARLVEKPAVSFVAPWHHDPRFVSLWVDALSAKMRSAGAATDDTHVVFTAHSLPVSVPERGDTYPEQFIWLCEAVAIGMGLRQWSPAYQSASGAGWLGPSLVDKVGELSSERGTKIMIAPIGFVTENLETLYDIDIECIGRFRDRGAEISRVGLPNASPRFVELLASAVVAAMEQTVRN